MSADSCKHILTRDHPTKNRAIWKELGTIRQERVSIAHVTSTIVGLILTRAPVIRRFVPLDSSKCRLPKRSASRSQAHVHRKFAAHTLHLFHLMSSLQVEARRKCQREMNRAKFFETDDLLISFNVKRITNFGQTGCGGLCFVTLCYACRYPYNPHTAI
jgi:hypothetical protein